MKTYLAILTAVLAVGCSQQKTDAVPPATPADAANPSAAADNMDMSAEEHAKMATGTATPSAATVGAGTSAMATGTVDKIDAAAGTITISHGPVESLNWPAMTMGFKATPEQVASVQAGQQVSFEFTSSGMDATITMIKTQ